jgi:hydrocephalus-inducing protein
LLRNNDNVARRVKILQPDSTFFKVVLNGKPGSKVAPGMFISYTMSFIPEELLTDYFCDLICCTEREKFVIPVKALGPRGWIDLPDEIAFEDAPVKAVATKTILARNMGDAECTFKIQSLSAPFSIDPPTGTLAVHESMQLHFSFHPDDTAPREGEFTVSYSSGEVVFVKVRGVAIELAVRMDSRTILMDPTYVSLFSQKSFKIINRSEHTVSYSFKQFASASDEQNARLQFGASAGGVRGLGVTGDVEFDYAFANDSFSVSPIQGEVWPNAETEITVTFTPSMSTEMSCVAFCDIIGKEHRLPLQLQGTGIGPRIVLSYNVIDIGEVFINSVSEYDVDLINQGDISASYELAPTFSVFGSKFKFEPSSGTLMVARREKVKISFSSDVLGDFEESFEWALLGTPMPLILTLRGKVIGPTFHIDQQILDFKCVSVAFLCTRHFHIFNSSDIPFRFHLRVPGDGALLKREFEVWTLRMHLLA